MVFVRQDPTSPPPSSQPWRTAGSLPPNSICSRRGLLRICTGSPSALVDGVKLGQCGVWTHPGVSFAMVDFDGDFEC